MTIRKFSRYLILVIHVLLAKKNITALYIENKQKKKKIMEKIKYENCCLQIKKLEKHNHIE